MSNTAPWYLRTEALALLADCAKGEPVDQIFTRPYTMSRDEWREYDREDARVDALLALYNACLTPLIEDEAACRDGRTVKAGLMVSVDMAIDAVVREPVCGDTTYYFADVARIAAEIALAMEGRVAA